MPSASNFLVGETARTKYIHSVGTVGKVKLILDDAYKADPKFSGIFKGAENGLVRLSCAAEPSSSQPLAPGMGLKFLRDKMDSANLVAMFSVNGQPDDWNFFAKDFTTHIGSASGLALDLLAKKFSTATDYIQVSGLADMASYDEQGQQET